MLDLPPAGRCILGSNLKARRQPLLKPMLKIEHLTKTYGGKPAVQDLCLHIRPGELCAFIGQWRGQDHYFKMLLRHPAI